MVANALLLFVPRISTYPQHVVIGEASAPERLGKILFLLWRWVKPKPICFLDIHLHTIYYLCEIVKYLRRTQQPSVALLSLPALKGEVSRSKI